MSEIPNDSSEHSEGFLKEFKQSLNKDILEDLTKFGIDKETPHPDIRKNSFYKKSGSTTLCPDEANVTFTDICHSFMSNPLSAVIGPYGSGKTTLLKRVAAYGIQSFNDHYCFFLKLSDMDYQHKISLKGLFKCQYPNLSDDEFTKAFDVLLHNQKNCLLMLDGLDEAKWWEQMKDKPPKLSYDEKAQIWEIIGNLLNKHLFNKAHVVFTSRTIAMLVLPYSLRPSNVYVVNGLTESTVQIRADHAWLTICKKIPAIMDLCRIPLLLNHVLDFIHESNDINRVTIATVLEATFDKMCTDHNARQNLNEAEKCKLQSLAFAVIDHNSFTKAEIRNQEIAIEKIQDFLEASPETSKQSSKVNEAKVLYHFVNPSIQAYLAARHLCNCDTSVLKKHVATVPDCVRRCLCGILFHKDLQDGQKIEQLDSKRDFFKEHMKTLLIGDKGSKTVLKCLTDIREGGEDLSKDLVHCFPVVVDCHEIPLTLSDIDALLRMVRIFGMVRAENVILLNLSQCQLKDSHLSEIQNCITEMEQQIEELNLSNNHFSEEKIKNFVAKFSSKQCKITALSQQTETSQVDQNFAEALSRETVSLSIETDTSFSAADSYEDTDKAFVDIPVEAKPHAVEPSAEPRQPQGDLDVTPENDRRSTSELPQDAPDQQDLSENGSISPPQPEKPPQDSCHDVESKVESENPSSAEATTAFLTGQRYDKGSEVYAGMAKVSICRGCSDKKFYAMKHCNCDLYTNMKFELDTMKALCHPNCIQYNTVAHDKQVDRSVIVMELCVATVRQYIKTGEQKCIDTERGEFISVPDIRKHLPISRLEIVRQSLEGVAHLHSLNYVHRDIKPENFLLTRNSNGCVVKVADFGLTRKQDNNRSSIKSQSRGSPSYMAPENHDGIYEFASDVFSFAIYAFEVFTLGQHPFGKTFQRQQCNIVENEAPNLDYLEAQKAAVTEEGRLLHVDTLTPDQRLCACDMLRRMLHPKRSERMDIWCVKSHPTFWEAKKKVEYFVDVQKTIENLLFLDPEAVAPLKLDEYDKSLGHYPTINKETFPAACLEARKFPVVFDVKKDPLLQLIKAIRDKAAHIGSLHTYEDDAVGATKSSPKISAFSDEEIKKYGISKPTLGREIEVCWEKFYEAFTGKAPYVLVHVYEKFRSVKMVNRKEYYSPQ